MLSCLETIPRCNVLLLTMTRQSITTWKTRLVTMEARGLPTQTEKLADPYPLRSDHDFCSALPT